MAGFFIGVGVGPGDPELITLKAARLIQGADVISYIANEAGQSQAKTIAADLLTGSGAGVDRQQHIAVLMPMCEDRSIANGIYDQAAANIQQALDAGKIVVFLCEGDPLFFGSFAYLLERLEMTNPCQVVPGISSVHAASAALQLPLTMLKESFAVVSGRHSPEQLTRTLQEFDSVVIMKAGRSRQKIIAAISDAGRLEEARYLEAIGRAEQRIETDLRMLEDETGPYFSLFVVIKNQRDRS